jgi:putative hydrolase of the HAD superfamily
VILILHVCAYIIVFGMPRQVKAVLFDYGNVLSRPQGRAEEAAMAAILNSPIARFQEVYWADRAAFDRAAITPEDYWDTVANRLSRTLTETERQRITKPDNLSWSYPEPTMVECGPRHSTRPA